MAFTSADSFSCSSRSASAASASWRYCFECSFSDARASCACLSARFVAASSSGKPLLAPPPLPPLAVYCSRSCSCSVSCSWRIVSSCAVSFVHSSRAAAVSFAAACSCSCAAATCTSASRRARAAASRSLYSAAFVSAHSLRSSSLSATRRADVSSFSFTALFCISCTRSSSWWRLILEDACSVSSSRSRSTSFFTSSHSCFDVLARTACRCASVFALISSSPRCCSCSCSSISLLEMVSSALYELLLASCHSDSCASNAFTFASSIVAFASARALPMRASSSDARTFSSEAVSCFSVSAVPARSCSSSASRTASTASASAARTLLAGSDDGSSAELAARSFDW
mmetsp:Transcript_44615/g.111065  ORF Transcript_44615/g.111065 Transcript_44615/m.111065 type:complete len:344 (+) Transcript_44615:1606-2637(+)